MDYITARLNVPHKTGPMSVPTGFDLTVNGPALLDLSVLCALESFDITKCGFRVRDGKGSRNIYPALGQTDGTAVFTGRGDYAPLMAKSSGFWIHDLNDEISGPEYFLHFDFYNEDAADFVVLIQAHVGVNDRPMQVEIHNFRDLLQSISGAFSETIREAIQARRG